MGNAVGKGRAPRALIVVLSLAMFVNQLPTVALARAVPDQATAPAVARSVPGAPSTPSGRSSEPRDGAPIRESAVQFAESAERSDALAPALQPDNSPTLDPTVSSEASFFYPAIQPQPIYSGPPAWQ